MKKNGIELTLNKIAQVIEKKEKVLTENLPKYRKSAYASCPKCGSKVSTQYLPGYDCPVCKEKNAFMSETIQNRVSGYDDQIKKLKKEYAALLKKNTAKKTSVVQKTPLEKGVDEVINYKLEVVYNIIPTPDFTEIHGTMGGDTLCFRVYKNGEIYEK